MIGTFLAKQGPSASDLFSIATKAGISRDKETGARKYDNSAAYLEAEELMVRCQDGCRLRRSFLYSPP